MSTTPPDTGSGEFASPAAADALQRAWLLHDQKRYDLAVTELRRCLAASPDSAYAHALLAECLANLGQLAEALREATEAIRLGPELGLPYRIYARILLQQNRVRDAESAILTAIRVEPFEPTNFQLLAFLQLQRSHWAGALEAAEHGLALQADNVALINARSRALIKLGRAEEALQAIDFALSVAPDDAHSHASKGWALLESRQTLPALEHFRESLRLDPSLDWARSGMLTALKARYPIYRVVLGYYFWMSRLPRQARYTVIVGLWLLNNILHGVADSHPELLPYILPITGLYILFCFLTWTSDPLFNTLLRFNRFGKYLLNRQQIATSNLVAGFTLGAVASLVGFLIRRAEGWELLTGGLALCAMVSAGTDKPRTRLPDRVRPFVEIGVSIVAILILLFLACSAGL